MATPAQWFAGARPRTLPAAVAPVAVGTGLAANADSLQVGRALLALAVAVALQVGVNFANDYSDGIKGTDAVRVGPVRLVGQRLATPAAVKRAAIVSFLVAVIAGFVLVALTGKWWLLGVGVASVAAGWLYTGGPRPYGYAGLGEVFVLVFFGLVPVAGTAYVQTYTIDAATIIAGIGVGLLACAILITNNLRDIPGDIDAGKRTLAVRIGDARTRTLYVAVVAAALVAPVLVAIALGSPWVLLTCASAVLAVRPVRIISGGARGPALIPALKDTGLLLLGYGLVFAVLIGIT